jgi:large subunit ribosomal protein L19
MKPTLYQAGSFGFRKLQEEKNMNVLEMIEKEEMRGDIPAFKTGDTVKVYVRIIEGQKQRVQAFEGVVIRKRRGNSRANFTVRKVSYGIGVERTFPMHSPVIDRIEVVSHGVVRRSRLYYLRSLRGKKARIKEAANR